MIIPPIFAARPPGGGPTPPSAIFKRTLNNYGAANLSTLSSAFVIFGHPFVKGEVPTGNIVTGDVAGVSVRVQDISCNSAGTSPAPLLEADGSLRWSLMVADLTGIDISTGSHADLTLTAGTGAWVTTTNRTNTEWINLVDTVRITNLATTGTSAADMNGAGTWTASFNTASAPNIVDIIGSSPLCRAVRVRAPFKNGATTHRFLLAWMYYFQMQKADGTAGPIASFGPIIDNTGVVHPADASQFNYDLNWLRNGVSQRAQTGILHTCLTFATMCRIDGRYDWTANDPTIWISQDYTKSRKTKKIPPYMDGLVYSPLTPAIPTTTITSIAAGVLTVGNLGSLVGLYLHEVAVRFTATVFPTGLAANTLYWIGAPNLGANTFKLYNNQVNAAAGGATGQVTPTGSFTALAAKLAVAPMSPGPFHQGMADGGERYDILGVMSEWGTSYHIGNSQAQQDMARCMAFAMATIPDYITDDVTGLIPGMISSPNDTPGGMFKQIDMQWDGNPANWHVNGTTAPTGGTNGWQTNTWHYPDTLYAVWVMEGNPFIRDLMMYQGNRAMGSVYPGIRNVTIDGTLYTGASCLVYNGYNARGGAWNTRGMAEAAFAAPEGSLYQTYFRNANKNNMAHTVAYSNYMGAAFKTLGVMASFVELNGNVVAGQPTTFPGVLNFHQAYMGMIMAWADLLIGDFVPDQTIIADQAANWFIGLYNGVTCNYYATNYTPGVARTGYLVTQPTVFVTSFDDIGVMSSGSTQFSYVLNGFDITYYNDPLLWTLAVGDRFRPNLNNCNGISPFGANAPPSPLVAGTDYWVVAVNTGASTFRISATQGGSAIQFGATVVDGGGYFMPTGQTCPPTSAGTVFTLAEHSALGSYIALEIPALALNAVRGKAGAATALAALMARTNIGSGGEPSFNNVSALAMQGTL